MARLRARIVCLLLPLACLGWSVALGLPGARYVPDAELYRLLATGERHVVPTPFSARILGPALAGWLGRLTGLGVDKGFLVLGVVCSVALLASITVLLWRSRAPAILFAAVFLMPFWADVFHDYYLPDLLHAALLAALVTALFFGHVRLALLLLFPAYLARESSLLVALCLLWAGWRRIPLRSGAVGLLALVGAGAVSRHFSQGAPGSVHGITGGTYILGKLVWSLFKNILGLPLWSNTLPECSPLWVRTLPAGFHLGAIRAIGLCQPSMWGPARLLLAWFGVFGIGPALVLALWPRMMSRAALSGSPGEENSGPVLVYRFCLLYGGISFLMTPLLGASVDRLAQYGWPLFLVALPGFLASVYSGADSAGLLCLHLAACWLAWFGFRHPANYLPCGLTVLAFNAIAYVLLSRRLNVSVTAPAPSPVNS